ncbi:hypothetical protein ERJ75_000451200 [Trypanosoma vivax]|nr:hypothetical protein ERJ75_000451200 [Trypanosoma vivax]
MPSKPGFFLQDARDAAAWARTVGEMGRAEGPHRIGARAYNRRRPLRAKSARPRMKAESPGGAPKGPRREEGPHHQARRQVRRNNRRLHRATRDAFAAGEWGATVRRAMRRWLASLVGSQKARSFGKQAAALGNAAPVPKPPKAFANDAGIIKATDRDPRLPAWRRERAASPSECERGPCGRRECP